MTQLEGKISIIIPSSFKVKVCMQERSKSVNPALLFSPHNMTVQYERSVCHCVCLSVCGVGVYRWGQVFILDSLSKYKASDAREAESIVERVTPRLQHANCAVVLSAVKVPHIHTHTHIHYYPSIHPSTLYALKSLNRIKFQAHFCLPQIN